MPIERKRLTPFVLSQVSSIASVVSGSMIYLAFPWLAIQLTGSAASAGLLITITSIPGLILAPVIGSIIDKFGRRRVGIYIEFLTGLATLLIPVVAGIWEMSLPLLMTVGFIRSTVASGSNTARKSLVPDVARAAGLSLERANSIQEAVFASGFAIGPALAAFCIDWFGIYNTFYVVVLTCFIAGGTMLFIRVHEYKEEHEDEKNIFKFAAEGFKILFNTPSVAILLSGVMVLAMIYLPTEMIVLPTYFEGAGDPQGLGVLLSTMALTTVFGALAFERLSKRFEYSTVFRISIIVFMVGMVPMAFLPHYFVMIFFGLILGFAWGPITPLLNTVIQRKIPPSKRGRVFSLEMVIWSVGPMVSMMFTGMAVDGFGVQPVYLVLAAAVVTSGVLIISSKYVKEINTADFAD